MKSIKMINLAAHFLLELCALAALIYWGFQIGEGLMKIVLGGLLPFYTLSTHTLAHSKA